MSIKMFYNVTWSPKSCHTINQKHRFKLGSDPLHSFFCHCRTLLSDGLLILFLTFPLEEQYTLFCVIQVRSCVPSFACLMWNRIVVPGFNHRDHAVSHGTKATARFHVEQTILYVTTESTLSHLYDDLHSGLLIIVSFFNCRWLLKPPSFQ